MVHNSAIVNKLVDDMQTLFSLLNRHYSVRCRHCAHFAKYFCPDISVIQLSMQGNYQPYLWLYLSYVLHRFAYRMC